MISLLTTDNDTFNLTEKTAKDLDLNFCVLEYSKDSEPDFIFPPLRTLDIFKRAGAMLTIGPYQLCVPLDWCILIGDRDTGDMEIIELKSLNDRDFKAFAFNPISGYLPSYLEINIIDILPDIDWWFPTVKKTQMISVPLTDNDRSLCVFLAKDASKFPPYIDISLVFT